ncbi:MAG TPA: hypothetical protein GXX29_12170 [Firmicutes bacterium]|nr:hypothetical protein [Bacillota bacterium]
MRRVRVATISMPRRNSLDSGLATALGLVDQAGLYRPDIIALPEACINDRQSPQPVPGPITEAMAAKARQLGSYLIIPLIELTAAGQCYNTAVLLDATGEIAGCYRKMFPTDYEMEAGIIPGEEAPVFTTTFGKIGIATCFDLNFPELISGLAEGGAEIVFFVSAYEGGRQLLYAALQNSVYIVSAFRGGIGYFVDKSGMLLQKGHGGRQPVVVRELNLDRYILHIDYNWQKIADIGRKYGAAIHVDIYAPEGIFALESLSDQVSVPDLMKEFNLETFQEYLARSRQLRRAKLAGAHVTSGPVAKR